MDLRPVTYRYHQPQEDGSQPMQYGLIAEEVEQVYPDLVVHAPDGQVQTVQYWKLDAMLLNEVQKLFHANQDMQARIEALSMRLAELERPIDRGRPSRR